MQTEDFTLVVQSKPHSEANIPDTSTDKPDKNSIANTRSIYIFRPIFTEIRYADRSVSSPFTNASDLA